MALATTASQTTLTFSADATVEFKTTRVSPEPASPEPGSPLRTPMPGRSKEFFATPQQSRQRDDDLVSMSPITPGYGLDPTPRPPSKTRFAAALAVTLGRSWMKLVSSSRFCSSSRRPRKGLTTMISALDSM